MSVAARPLPVSFSARELGLILNVYARFVAAGEWRDYAIDFDAHEATFSVYRRSSEQPIYRIRKCPALAQRQGAFALLAPGGVILKRGADLELVLRQLDQTWMRLVNRRD